MVFSFKKSENSKYSVVLNIKIKHINIKHHFIRQNIMNGDTELYFLPKEEHITEFFTKSYDELKVNKISKILYGI